MKKGIKMYKDFFGLDKADRSWDEFINEHQSFLNSASDRLSKTGGFTPEPSKILRIFNMPADKIKVIILGQDPYPQSGAASGLAFEFCLIDDWTQPFAQVSLKNILRAIYLSETGKNVKWTQLRNEISSKRFKVAPPTELFKSWERQGVLCLNTSLTCLLGKPDSHRRLWSEFCADLINYTADRNPSAYWFLWGNRAREFERQLRVKDQHGDRIFCSRHPMLCGLDVPDDFLKCKCFEKTSDLIDWRGLK